MRRILALLLALCLFLSAVPMGAFAAENTSGNIQDYFYKIMHLDAARKYFSVENIKDLIDVSADAGFNQIELYLSDNQGFRLGLDDMTVTTEFGTYDMTPALGAGYSQDPHYTDGKEIWLTQAEMDEIIAYANQKGLDVVPCINAPGHMGALLEAFPQFRYGATINGTYTVSKSALNLWNEEAYAFGLAFIEKYAQYFKSRGVKTFNFGADEFGCDMMTNSGTGENNGMDLVYNSGGYDEFVDFINEEIALLKEMGLQPRAFSDCIYYTGTDVYNGETLYIDTDLEVCYWNGGWYWSSWFRRADADYLASKGFRMINTNGDYYHILGGDLCTPEEASQFDYEYFHSFDSSKNIYLSDVAGAMFCIWCDDARDETCTSDAAVAGVLDTITAFGGTLPTPATASVTDSGITVTAPGLTAVTVEEVNAPAMEGISEIIAYEVAPATAFGSYYGSLNVSIPVPAGFAASRTKAALVTNGSEPVNVAGKIENGNYVFAFDYYAAENPVVVLYEVPATEKKIEVAVNETIEIVIGADLTGDYTTANPNVAGVTVDVTVTEASVAPTNNKVTSLTSGRYYLYNGADYLVVKDGAFTRVSAAEATPWTATVNSSGTVNFKQDFYYLSNTYSASSGYVFKPLTSEPHTSWYYDSNGIYAYIYNANYYFCYNTNGWFGGDASNAYAHYMAYEVEEIPASAETVITFTGMSAGTTEVEIGDTKYVITVTGGDDVTEPIETEPSEPETEPTEPETEPTEPETEPTEPETEPTEPETEPTEPETEPTEPETEPTEPVTEPTEPETEPTEPETEPTEPEVVGPQITQQPVDYVGLVGDTAIFTVAAEGEDLSYQWYYFDRAESEWKKASNGTAATLNVEFKAYRNNQQYRCEITDGEGNTVVTDVAKIIAQPMDLAIVSHPVSYVGAVNDEVTFTVEATGNGLVYQWYYSDDDGANWYLSGSPGFAAKAVSPILRAYRDGNMYRCVITDVFGNTVTSEAASLNIKASEITITQQPASVENAAFNGLYTFSVAAEGDNLTYLWEVSSDGGETWTQSWNDGYNTATLNVRMYANRSGNQYRCVITSGQKTVAVTEAATLTMQAPSVEIVTQPENVSAVSGAAATFTVEAAGTGLSYAWYRSNDGGTTWVQTFLDGHDTNTLSFTANSGRAAMFMCKVTDGSGKVVWTNPVKLQVLSAGLQVLTQPESIICASGETAVFTVEAQGDGLKYQWYSSADGGATWTMSFLSGYNTAEYSFVVNASRAAKVYKCVITDAAGNTVETNAVSVTIKTEEPETPVEPEIPENPVTDDITVAYVPIDNRPVNVDRVIYLAGAAGFEIVMPAEDDYATVLAGADSHGGNPENLLAWLKTQEAAGVDHYVISLDQMFSGGLCSSRSTSQMTTTANGDILEYEIADYLVELAEDNYVVFFDTVIRLAPETSYQNFSTEQYHALRSYGSQLRSVLTGSSLTIDNIVAGYRYGQYGETIGKTYTYLDYSDYQYKTATVEESVLSTHLAARERKLRLIDYVIRNVGTTADHLYIGVDDSSANENIQYNERQYIHKIAAEYGVNYQLFAGADELGMMGIAALAGDYYGKVNANVTYFGGGADMDPADNYDYQSLRTTMNLHLEALGVNVLSTYDSHALQILVLTQSTSTSTYAAELVAQLRSNLDAGIPTCVLDCSNAGANNSRILSDHILGHSWNNSGAYALAETLAISCWNTIGNTIGIGLSNAVGRYAYIYNSEEVTEESNEAFVKTMTFALVKDISYRAHTYGNDTSNANYNMYGRFNFDNSSWDDVVRVLEKLNTKNTILGKDGQKVTFGTVSIDENSVEWTWNRDFECSFEIDVAN